MWRKRDWRHRSTSKRRKLVQALSSGHDSFRLQSTSRARQIYYFFADFWRSTPHPIAQVCLLYIFSHTRVHVCYRIKHLTRHHS